MMATDTAHTGPTDEFVDPDPAGSERNAKAEYAHAAESLAPVDGAELDADLDVDAEQAGSVRGGVAPAGHKSTSQDGLGIIANK
jgi:hypothetical protein